MFSSLEELLRTPRAMSSSPPYSVPLQALVRAPPASRGAASPDLVVTNRTHADVERRVLQLIELAHLCEGIRDETKLAKKMIKYKVSQSFEDVHANLRRLEAKLSDRIESQLVQKRVDMSLRGLDYDISQLLGKLRNMTVKNDDTVVNSDKEHEHAMNYVDASIKQIEKSYVDLEAYKKAELDWLTSGSRSGGRRDVSNAINEQVRSLNRFIESETLNLNHSHLDGPTTSPKARGDDYNDWLLRAAPEEPSGLKKEHRTNSFELLDVDQELDVLADIDDDEFEAIECHEPMAASHECAAAMCSSKIKQSDDGVSRIFHEIYSKPIDYWLLKPRPTH